MLTGGRTIRPCLPLSSSSPPDCVIIAVLSSRVAHWGAFVLPPATAFREGSLKATWGPLLDGYLQHTYPGNILSHPKKRRKTAAGAPAGARATAVGVALPAVPPFQSNSPLRAIDATDRPHPLEGQLDGIDDPSQFAAAEARSQDLSVGPAPSTNTLNFCKVAIDGMYKLSTTAKKDDYLALARALNIILSVDTFTSQANRLIWRRSLQGFSLRVLTLIIFLQLLKSRISRVSLLQREIWPAPLLLLPLVLLLLQGVLLLQLHTRPPLSRSWSLLPVLLKPKQALLND